MNRKINLQNIKYEQLSSYVELQIMNYFPLSKFDSMLLEKYITIAFDRIVVNFRYIKKKYYSDGNKILFNIFNSDHYAIFLYLLSNTAYQYEGDSELATKLFLLNKALHAIDVFYSIKLPECFYFVHPVGTVLGNATYGNFFVVYQGCTVGSKVDGPYPHFSEGTILYEKSSVIGSSHIGSNVIMAANSFIIDCDIKSNKVVLGHFPNNRIINNSCNVIRTMFCEIDSIIV